MKSLTSWLIAIFAFMYWGFRVVVAVTSTMGIDFAVTPLNSSWEVPLLFITFICICFIPKRKLIPVLIYLILHGGYYGVDLYNNVMAIINNEAILSSYVSLLSSLIGIAIPLFALFDILLDKNRTAHPKDKKTDWFYKNEQYDRKLDERADKNNYRTL